MRGGVPARAPPVPHPTSDTATINCQLGLCEINSAYRGKRNTYEHCSMERTPTKNPHYGSDPNLHTAMGKNWISSRQNKKKREFQDSDSDEATSQSSRRYKSTCCSTSDILTDALNAFREELKAMHNLLNTMKEDQESNYVQIKSDISELKGEIIELKIKNIEKEKVIEEIERNCTEITKKQEAFMDNTKKQENILKDLIQKNTYFDKYNKSLEERIRILEQRQYDLDVELVNVEQKEEENVTEIVENIAKKLKLNNEDIIKAQRIKGQRVGDKPKPIVVTLRTKEARIKWLKCKKVALTNHTLYNNNNNQRIFINERVTRQTRQLLWSTKLQLKDKYKFIWIQKGRVLLRKNEDEKNVENVSCESDIDKLLKNLNGKQSE